MFDSLCLPILLLVFAGAAVVWVAGVRLSNTTDVLSTRLGLGEALGGLIMPATVTNLLEIAITASAALSNNVGVAVGNILGGIAIQTVVLIVLDAFGVRGTDPLTYRAASLVLVLEAALVIAVLTVAVMGTHLPPSLVFERVAPGGLGGCPRHPRRRRDTGAERRRHRRERRDERGALRLDLPRRRHLSPRARPVSRP